MKAIKFFAIATLFLGISSVSFGQSSATINNVSAGANIINAIKIENTDNIGLHFGDIVSQAATFDVTVTPAEGRTSTNPAAIAFTGDNIINPHTAAQFKVTGENNANYKITLPGDSDVTLTNVGGGAPMAVKGFTSDKTDEKSTLDGSGIDNFKVGATLTVGANQAAGLYTGTFIVTVAYE